MYKHICTTQREPRPLEILLIPFYEIRNFNVGCGVFEDCPVQAPPAVVHPIPVFLPGRLVEVCLYSSSLISALRLLLQLPLL